MFRRMSDYPKEVAVGDSLWKVRFVDAVPERAGKGRVLVGLACPMDQTLYILKRMSPFDRLVVFLHEATHALEDEHGFEIDHATLNKLDKSWAQFLCDNFIGQLSKKCRGNPRIKSFA
jgi:hypothetical protein